MIRQKHVTDFDDLLNDEVEITIPKNILEKVVDFVRTELTPDDVWDDDILRTYVGKTSLPEDVFDEKQLGDWATENGYTKE